MYLMVFRKRDDIDYAAYHAQAEDVERLARTQQGFVSFKCYPRSANFHDLSYTHAVNYGARCGTTSDRRPCSRRITPRLTGPGFCL